MEALKQKAVKGYELKEKIGTGGFGAVYRAHQTTVGREVAIKIILPTLASQPDFIRRFEGEAQLVAKLEHPHITPLYDYWRDPEGAYLVMRWLRGGSLRDTLDKAKFELRAAALLLDQIAGALSLAHRNGIIHRDIKPANILLDEDGNAYLTDFGIAKDLSISSNGTQPDMIVGSLDYISPEQARSEAVSSRTDIYSLGVTLYEMVVGEHPFGSISPIERLYKHINDPLPQITGFENAAEINRVIQKATAKNPENRYPDALAFAAEFREAIGLNRTSTSVVEILTQREQEILQLIIEGLSNKEIAQKLTITHGTVKWYVNQIYEKLGVRSRVQAMVRARELNLIVKGNENQDALRVSTEEFQAENPYKGLRAFQAADYQDFFGREKITGKLLKRMEERAEFGRFLAIVGPSGSGKSSLAKAGLIPALWRGELAGSEKWFIVEMTPGTHPIDELEIALTKLAANQAANLHEHLQRDAQGLLRAANLILPNDDSELLLMIDQFEEVFTMSEDEAARKHFLDLLYTAVTNAKSRVRLIITLRADFYDRPLHYTNFGEMLRSRLETILPLSAEELERAISKPAERVGVVFEAGLVASMVADMNYQSGALPLLQYALTELFERRKGRLLSHEAYEAMGKSTGALAKRADETYESFDEAGKQAAKQLFLRLVLVTDGVEDTRRRAGRSELLALGDSEIMEDVIEAFSSYRLLTLDNDPVNREPVVEVAHEAILREWERLRDWLKESREDLRVQRQVAGMTKEWADARQDKSFLARGSRLDSFEEWAESTELLMTGLEREFIGKSIEARELESEKEAQQVARETVLKQRSVRVMRVLIAVLTLALLGAFALAGYVMNERNQAQSERDNAQSLALASGAQLAYSSGDAETAVSLAMQANQTGEANFLAERVLYDVSTGYGIRHFIPNPSGSEFHSMALSDNDQYLAAIAADGSYYIWDASNAQELFSYPASLRPYRSSVTFSRDYQYVLFSILDEARNYQCLVYDAATGREIAHLESSEYFWLCNQILDDGRIFVWGRELASGTGAVGFWDYTTGQLSVQSISEVDTTVSFYALASYNGAVASINRQNLSQNRTSTQLWDLADGGLSDSALDDGGMVTYRFIRFSPNNQNFITIDTAWSQTHVGDVNLRLWELSSERPSWEVMLRFYDADYNNDGQFLLSSDEDNFIRLWNVSTGTELASYHYPLSIYELGFGSALFAGRSYDGIRIWEFEDNLTETLIPRSGNLAGILLNSNASILAVASGASIQVYQQNENRYEPMPHLFYRSVSALVIDETHMSNDGSRLLSRYQGLWRVYDIATGDEILKLQGVMGDVARFSPDASLMAILQGNADESADNNFTIVEIQTGEVLSSFSTNISELGRRSFALSNDNQRVFVGLMTGNIGIFDTQSGNLLEEFEGDGSQIVALNLSADGQKLYAASQEANLYVWDTTTGGLLSHFERVGLVEEIRLSSEGERIYLTMHDNSFKILDSRWGITIRVIPIPQAARGGRVLDNGEAAIFVAEDSRIVRQELLMDRSSLMNWVQNNRYIAPLRCDQRALYQLEPLCNE